MAFLDGYYVDDAAITPAAHTFIGMFRRPFNLPTAEYVLCGCGRMLHTTEQCREHWMSGHWDVPQYRTIDSQREKATA